MLSDFGNILIFIIGAILFCFVAVGFSSLLRPNRPNPEKLSTYESGEEALGNAWGQINVRFYIIGLVFLLFEAEIVFLLPWATVFGQKDLVEGTGGKWGWFAIWEIFIFIGLLILGFAYVWSKGFLEWDRPKQKIININSKVPRKLYDEVNKKYEYKPKKKSVKP